MRLTGAQERNQQRFEAEFCSLALAMVKELSDSPFCSLARLLSVGGVLRVVSQYAA